MKHPWSWAIATAILLSGCGAAPTTPTAASAAASQAQASNLGDSIATRAAWNAQEGRASVSFDVSTLTGKKSQEDRITYSTDGGKTGAISKLLLGKDGGLFVERTTAQPRVYTYHRVGTYQSAKALADGASLTCKLLGGAKFKSRRGLPIPMLDYRYVMVVLPELPAAEKTTPEWAKL